MKNEKDLSIYTTPSGFQLKLSAAPIGLVEKIQGSVKRPERPKYTVTTASGEEEVHFHDESTLSTDKEKEEWDNYIKGSKAVEDELNNRLLNAIALESVRYLNFDEEQWVKRQKQFYGLDVPSNPDERHVHIFWAEVVRSKDIVDEVFRRTLVLAGVDEEAIRETENSFPG